MMGPFTKTGATSAQTAFNTEMSLLRVIVKHNYEGLSSCGLALISSAS